MAFATIRPDLLMQAIAATVPAQLAVCLVDTDPLAAQRRLAGPVACESLAGGTPVRLRPLHYAGRSRNIKVYAKDGVLEAGGRHSWAFGAVGLLSTALSGALLLTITGRARRIGALVQTRTAELQHEVRQREQASQALAQSEQRFRNIFDHVPIGLVFTDLDGFPREANPQFCSMLGYPAETLAGMRSLDFTHPDDRAEDLRPKGAGGSGPRHGHTAA